MAGMRDELCWVGWWHVVVAGMRDELCCACGWDKLCSVGRRLWKLLQSCNDWIGVREAGTQITQDTALLAAGLVSAYPPRSQATRSARLVFCRIHAPTHASLVATHNAKLRCEHSHSAQPRNSVLK